MVYNRLHKRDKRVTSMANTNEPSFSELYTEQSLSRLGAIVADALETLVQAKSMIAATEAQLVQAQRLIEAIYLAQESGS